MADVWATKNGVWSDTTVWNTGSLPTAADDVYADNRSVTIDISTQILSIRTTQRTGGTAGGSFFINNGISLSAGLILPGTTTCLTFLSASPNTITITGNISGSPTTASVFGVLNNSSGTVNLFGSAQGGTANASGAGALRNNSTGTMNIVGNIIGGGPGTDSEGLRNISTGTVNLTGNARGGTGGASASDTASCVAIRNSGGGLVTILGNLSGWTNSYTYGLANMSTGTVLITGNVVGGIGGTGPYGLYTSNSNAGNIIIYGNIFNNGTTASIFTNNACQLTVYGNVSAINGNGIQHNAAALGKTIVYGNVYGGIIGASVQGIIMGTSNGVVEVYGSSFGGNTTTSYGVYSNATNTSIYVSGSAFGGSGTSSFGVINGSSGIATVAGDAIGGSGGASYGAQNNSSGIFNIYGSARGGSSAGAAGAVNVSTGTMYISGNAIGGINAADSGGVIAVGAQNSSSGRLFIYGAAVASDIVNGVRNQSTGLLYAKRVVGNQFGLGTVGVNSVVSLANSTQSGLAYVEQVEFGPRGQTPIAGPVYILPSNQNTLTGVLTALGNTVTFYNSLSVDGLLPPASSVQLGTVYNVGNSVGTMAVPSASAVEFGVPVDNTVGVAALTPQTVWGYSRLSATDVGSMGDRLRNAATAQSVGSQIASFNL